VLVSAVESPETSTVTHVPPGTVVDAVKAQVAGIEDVAAVLITQLPPVMAVPNAQPVAPPAFVFVIDG
jgi:hypothetical protein